MKRLMNIGKENQGDSAVNDVYRWLFVSLISLIIWCISSARGYCQAVSNPGEYTVLAAGNVLINSTVKSERNAQAETAALQVMMSGEFTKIKQWESKYNSYLKTAEGYASALKAATGIYDDGMRIILALGKLRKACSDNPQGIVATLSMNNLYLETATELVSVFSLLKDGVSKGGAENMLTGAERSKMLWALEERMKSLSEKLQLLYYSIRHYRMADVWQRATAGMIEHNRGEVARQSLSHWKRYAKEVSQYSGTSK